MALDGDAPVAGPAPLVSVVVATFNSRLTLACALDSVRRQSHQDFEVWVVGDACTDGSDTIVAALGDPRFHWTNLPWNSGSQAGPNNEGLRRARGRFVAYLGHDDLLVSVASRDARRGRLERGRLVRARSRRDARAPLESRPPARRAAARHIAATACRRPTGWSNGRCSRASGRGVSPARSDGRWTSTSSIASLRPGRASPVRRA